MRIAYVVILFFLCLNVGSFIVAELDLLPTKTSPYANPETIATEQLTLPTEIAAITILVIGSIIARNPLVTIAGLIVFAVGKFLPFGGWVVTGVPEFLTLLNLPSVIVVGVKLLVYFVWFWAIMQFLSGRLDIG